MCRVLALVVGHHNVSPPLAQHNTQLEQDLVAAKRELSDRATQLQAASLRVQEAEGARDAAAAESRWLRVKLANEGEARRDVEARLEEASAELAARVSSHSRVACVCFGGFVRARERAGERECWVDCVCSL